MYDAIVLAGGSAARLGGADKPALELGGESLLERVVAALADATRVVVVGPERPISRNVLWCREEPAGGGPVAALAEGLAHVSADVVMTLAADLPWIAPAVPILEMALAGFGSDCVALADGAGRVNYLAAAWRRASLERALASLAQPRGASMTELVRASVLVEIPDAGGWGRDCDTWSDVADARLRLRGEGTGR